MKNYFKTLDDQINILKNRGLIINDENEAKSALLRYNYFKIVNATYDFFIERDGNKIKYREGTDFEDLMDVHNFDKELKKILLASMLEVERILRSIISYKFINKYPKEDDYLNPKNYSHENKEFIIVNIDSIKDVISKYESEDNFNRTMKYYTKKYSTIPLWFVINFISFGKLVNIYETLDHELKEDIADEFQSFLEENLGESIEGHITPSQLFSFIDNAKEIRNISAHDNLIIGHKFPNIAYFEPIHSKYGVKGHDRTSLYDTVVILKALLPKDEFDKLENQIKKNINELETLVDRKAFNMIIKKIGLDKYK